MTNVNNTWSDAQGTYLMSCKAYCYDALLGEGYSNNFSVESGSSAWAAVIVNPKPAHISINAARNTLVANGSDYVSVWAYVTDALNHPVADNTQVMFSINYGGYYSYLRNGSWSGPSNASQMIEVRTVGGYAYTTYGWVPEGNAGNSSTLRAVCLVDAGISATMSITFQSSGTQPGPGFPCVILGKVTYNGAPVQGAQVVATPWGDTEITDVNGNYSVDVPSGSSVEITATYNGSSATLSGINTPANGGIVYGQDISITSTQIYIMNLSTGWNLVCVPLNNNALKASDLVGNASLGVDMVSMYNNSTGGYTTYYTGAATWKNMKLSPDRGYFVHSVHSGSLPCYGNLLLPHNVNIYQGWNLLGWSGSSNTSASDVMSQVSLSMISRYNNSARIYQSYYSGANPTRNFTLTSGEGYFLRSSVPAVQQLYIG